MDQESREQIGFALVILCPFLVILLAIMASQCTPVVLGT